MIIRYKLPGDQIEVEIDVSSEQEIFSRLGQIQELFGRCKCGSCDSTNVYFSHRTPQGYDYYQLTCQNCGCDFHFGQRQDGTGLFPKLKDQDGNLLPNGGWSVYERGGSGQSSKTRETVPAGNDESGPVSDNDIPFSWAILVGTSSVLTMGAQYAQDLLQVWT